MTELSIFESLGLTQEQAQERAIERVVERMLFSKGRGEDGDYQYSSAFKKGIEAAVKQAIDDKIDAIADAHIAPNISAIIDAVTFKPTSKWGEPKGDEKTFLEYLIDRAENYMTEQVDHEGKSKTETRFSSWTGKSTRVTYMVHKHLHYHIETAMKNALADVNSKIATGLNEAVKMAIKTASENMVTHVTIKK